MDTTGAIVPKRQLSTASSAAPDLAELVRREPARELGHEIESVRVDCVGHRSACCCPSRYDDLVLRVELRAPEADDRARALERMADQRAWLHRAVLREVTRRLALQVAAS